MKRAQVEAFAETPFDILVFGEGVYGMMAARDAALRGLRTALVERADFGQLALAHARRHPRVALPRLPAHPRLGARARLQAVGGAVRSCGRWISPCRF